MWRKHFMRQVRQVDFHGVKLMIFGGGSTVREVIISWLNKREVSSLKKHRFHRIIPEKNRFPTKNFWFLLSFFQLTTASFREEMFVALGVNQACRGHDPSDDNGAYYVVVTANSLNECRDQCFLMKRPVKIRMMMMKKK